jgi:biotin transport system substrate-specific component
MNFRIGVMSKGIMSSKIYTQILWIAGFALFTAFSAQIEIPTQPVPFTLQTFFVLLAGPILGKRNAFFSMSLYISSGVFGLPVFAGGSFGLLKLLGPTGGYLMSFPFAAYLIGYLYEKNQSYIWIISSLLIGLLMIFTCGIIVLNFGFLHNWKKSFETGFLIFSYWDILKLIAASSICYCIRKKKII